MGTVGDLAASGGGADFSFLALFLRAHLFVQAVIVVLVLFSVWSWAIILEKSRSMVRTRRTALAFEDAFWSGAALDGLYERIGDAPTSPMERVFVAGMREWNRSFGDGGDPLTGSSFRIERALDVAVARELDLLQERLGVLATVGSVSPFVGLFGTVWGIKNSFESIALSQNTNLAVVAPGIAEALVATALGLLAAIPAVVAYNRFTGEATRLGARLENFADEFVTVVSRQIDAIK